MKAVKLFEEQDEINKMPKEAKQILEILDQISIYTANLRTKLMLDLKLKIDNTPVRIKIES
jgi:hypothetical protein